MAPAYWCAVLWCCCCSVCREGACMAPCYWCAAASIHCCAAVLGAVVVMHGTWLLVSCLFAEGHAWCLATGMLL